MNTINNNDLAVIPKDKINRSGRKKGSKNKATQNVRDQFQMLVESNISQLQSDLDEMSAKERFQSIVSLASYVLPKLNSIDFTSKTRNMFKPVQLNFSNEEE